MKVGRKFYFDAAHYLPEYKGKCEQLHGHTYALEVVIEDEPKEGMVMDFNKLKKIVKEEILNKLDHRTLNEIFDNPTTENICLWIFNHLEKKIPLASVRLYEGKDKWVKIEK